MREPCTRCGTRPPEFRRKGDAVFKALFGCDTTTVRHRLRFNLWRHHGWTEDPGDQVTLAYTELELCAMCASDVLDFAQGKPVPTTPEPEGT